MGAASLISICYHCTICNPLFIICSKHPDKALNSWLPEVVTGYHIKINLARSVSVLLFALQLQSEPFKTLETANICMLMASLLVSHILSQIPMYDITDDTYVDSLSNGTNK